MHRNVFRPKMLTVDIKSFIFIKGKYINTLQTMVIKCSIRVVFSVYMSKWLLKIIC